MPAPSDQSKPDLSPAQRMQLGRALVTEHIRAVAQVQYRLLLEAYPHLRMPGTSESPLVPSATSLGPRT